MSVECCGKKAQWTILSPRISYWYCKECKQEVVPVGRKEAAKRLTQAEIDELFTPPTYKSTWKQSHDDDDGDVYLKKSLIHHFDNCTIESLNGFRWVTQKDLDIWNNAEIITVPGFGPPEPNWRETDETI